MQIACPGEVRARLLGFRLIFQCTSNFHRLCFFLFIESFNMWKAYLIPSGMSCENPSEVWSTFCSTSYCKCILKIVDRVQKVKKKESMECPKKIGCDINSFRSPLHNSEYNVRLIRWFSIETAKTWTYSASCIMTKSKCFRNCFYNTHLQR